MAKMTTKSRNQEATAPKGGGEGVQDAPTPAGAVSDLGSEKKSQKGARVPYFNAELVQASLADTRQIYDRIRALEDFVVFGAHDDSNESEMKRAFSILVYVWGRESPNMVNLYMRACQFSDAAKLTKNGYYPHVAERIAKWHLQVADWTGRLLAKHYAHIGQEDAAYIDKNKKVAAPHQTSNLLATFVEGKISPVSGNPFRYYWLKYRYDKGLRSISAIRDFVEAVLDRDTVQGVFYEIAEERDCLLTGHPPQLFAHDEFEDLWPYLRKHLRHRINAHKLLWKKSARGKWTLVDPSKLINDKFWGPRLQEWRQYYSGPDGYEFWKETINVFRAQDGLMRFSPDQLNWSKCQTRCKATAREIFCESDNDELERWKPSELQKTRSKYPMSRLFVSRADWLAERAKMATTQAG